SALVVPETRTNSLIVTTSVERMAVLEATIHELDTPARPPANTFVVRLQNARSTDVATMLNQSFYSTGRPSSSSSSYGSSGFGGFGGGGFGGGGGGRSSFSPGAYQGGAPGPPPVSAASLESAPAGADPATMQQLAQAPGGGFGGGVGGTRPGSGTGITSPFN